MAWQVLPYNVCPKYVAKYVPFCESPSIPVTIKWGGQTIVVTLAVVPSADWSTDYVNVGHSNH